MSDNISFSSNRSTIQKYKIVLVGDQNVGKSSIIARYIRNEFDPSKNPTIGIDFISKNISSNGKMLRLQLWDTAGQERFKSLIPSYLKDAHIALVVFDLANTPSAEGVAKWIDFIRQAGNREIRIYVVGNKLDLENQISSDTRKMIQELAEKQANSYKQVSAKTNANIEEVFGGIIDELLSQKKKETVVPINSAANGKVNSRVENKPEQVLKLTSIDSKPEKTTKGGCCQR